MQRKHTTLIHPRTDVDAGVLDIKTNRRDFVGRIIFVTLFQLLLAWLTKSLFRDSTPINLEIFGIVMVLFWVVFWWTKSYHVRFSTAGVEIHQRGRKRCLSWEEITACEVIYGFRYGIRQRTLLRFLEANGELVGQVAIADYFPWQQDRFVNRIRQWFAEEVRGDEVSVPMSNRETTTANLSSSKEEIMHILNRPR